MARYIWYLVILILTCQNGVKVWPTFWSTYGNIVAPMVEETPLGFLKNGACNLPIMTHRLSLSSNYNSAVFRQDVISEFYDEKGRVRFTFFELHTILRAIV